MFNNVVLRTVTSCLLALLLRSSGLGAELSKARNNVHVACYSAVTQCSRAAEEDHVARVVRVLLIDFLTSQTHASSPRHPSSLFAEEVLQYHRTEQYVVAPSHVRVRA